MIHTSRQLKDKVRNITHGNNEMAQMLIRNFVMERFLERVSKSEYNKNFILKGGMLVASMVGIETRATMDIDTTVRALPLNQEDAERIVKEILEVQIEDGMNFEIVKISDIMTDFEYPGIRMMVEGKLDHLRQRIKIDISTDDVITPAAIKYDYKLMFEDRSIEIMTYTPETLISEKVQTILARSIATTRMRDYYDVYEITCDPLVNIDEKLLREAFDATCRKRETIFELSQVQKILKRIMDDVELPALWDRYKKENFYVGNLEWETVCKTVCRYIETALIDNDKSKI
jgi:predicted nucleotidyltransferase component of viral defense system